MPRIRWLSIRMLRMDFATNIGLWWGMTNRKRITRLCTRMGIAMEDMVDRLLTSHALSDDDLGLMLTSAGRTLARVQILLDNASRLAGRGSAEPK